MHDELASALSELAREIRESRQERSRQLVTKYDLVATEARIVFALKGVSVDEAQRITASLKASTDKVEQAVASQSPST